MICVIYNGYHLENNIHNLEYTQTIFMTQNTSKTNKKYSQKLLQENQYQNFKIKLKKKILQKLQIISVNKQNIMIRYNIKHEADMLFIHADKDGNMNLNLQEIKQILKKMQISINKEYLIKLFQENDKNQNGQIDKKEFVEIIRKLSRKTEIQNIFQKYCIQYTGKQEDDTKSLMTVIQYQNFSKNEQKESISLLETIHIFKSVAHEHQETLRISFQQFSELIFSEKNSIFHPKNEQVYQDMDQPLTSYYINSSHNTYLLSNQLTGDSSTQAYINAIQKGCRCLELDCWDGDEGEPIIYHGYTLTSKILFRKVIEVINENAFKYSEFPLILSFENHCCAKMQIKMAQICVEIFKDKLYKVPEDWESIQHYLSPNKLKMKIIIKNSGKLEQAINKDVFFDQLLLQKAQINDVNEDDEAENLVLKNQKQFNNQDYYMQIIKNSQCLPLEIQQKQQKKKKIVEQKNQGKKCTIFLQKSINQLLTTQTSNQEQENITEQDEPIIQKQIELLKHNIKGQSEIQIKTSNKVQEMPQLIKIASMFGCKMSLNDSKENVGTQVLQMRQNFPCTTKNLCRN
ncbi:phosphatidylinositol-specific phospholipase x domain protein [Ichthyophthirius multifiliis]|uniref:Phosphoinositide phospholipase C n=1 Tax=Ichthyophthirius multifiliis TaxID=5932 RepID=G0R4H8_ICHMU|nr:phosphatidylinositol-specific phospholipase x domain protein [Ichthyophthirius multifiliis]EGR27629.1 phosphatidylinositol-specific phospholipase x domain protein [Ichthyophthirius multifiliis]|eukprot:XP_004025081.1 phosphatidylinositol-specific phospholipase x domain protein [Ichthyophthirius multifiliis]